jgi:phage shock protein PspC (stress-responsive transcriptional regulator)
MAVDRPINPILHEFRFYHSDSGLPHGCCLVLISGIGEFPLSMVGLTSGGVPAIPCVHPCPSSDPHNRSKNNDFLPMELLAWKLHDYSCGLNLKRMTMNENDVFEEMREALNGRAGQPIVFGVCQTLASRFGCETWITRLVAIVFGVVYTLPALMAYVVLGLVLTETEPRTRGFFSGMSVIVRENVEKLLRTTRDAFSQHPH